MDDCREKCAIIIQRSFRRYLKSIKKSSNPGPIANDRTPSKRQTIPSAENKSRVLRSETEKVCEGLWLFHQNVSARRSRRTYLATLLNDIDKNLSLLRNITSLDACQNVNFTNTEKSQEIFGAKTRHEEQLRKLNHDLDT